VAVEVKLSKPLVVAAAVKAPDGKETQPAREVSALSLNFDALTGQHWINAERDAVMAEAGAPIVVPKVNAQFQVHLAAYACGVSVDVLKGLPLRDFAAVTEAARDFLLGTD
jgi:hypothetical protein